VVSLVFRWASERDEMVPRNESGQDFSRADSTVEAIVNVACLFSR
jgi:hypothetical protein